MNEFRRLALFELLVVGLTAIAVVVLFVVTHNVLASQAGFALLALLGFRALFRRGRSSVEDERDAEIQRRAALIAFVALWIGLVAWGVFVPLRYGDAGVVPLAWVAPVVWVAAWLVTGVRSVTILVLDRSGA